MRTIKRRSRSRQKSMKYKGGSRSSGSSLLKELEDKYSKSSLPSTASVDKMMSELDPSSNSKKGGLGVLGVALGVLVLAVVGINLKKIIK